jgi:acyl transferase domain-containing protein
MLAAWQAAAVEAETISYIEAHGTGTKLGDPIEIKGINDAFARGTHSRPQCGIGSVKTNIGHLVGAAGVAGLTKTVLSLKHKKVFPSLHFKERECEARGRQFVRVEWDQRSSDFGRSTGGAKE